MENLPIAAGKSSFGLIDEQLLFRELKLNDELFLSDLACGVGNYSLAASERIKKGRIYAYDLWAEGIETLKSEIKERKISNIIAEICDISKKIPLPDKKIDLCLLATVAHDLIEDNTFDGTMLEADRILKNEGTIAIIEFKKIDGPPGPPKNLRLSPDELKNIMNRHAYIEINSANIGDYNYLSLFRKK